MSEETVLRYSAPTLAKIKTASLFTCAVESREELLEAMRRYNRLFVKKGIRMMPLRYKDGRALVYIYRPSLLKQDLRNSYARKYLGELGYTLDSIGVSVMELIRRIQSVQDFPHEIGFFLGYPAEDVKGFIDCKAVNYKSKGYWKVYSDPERAEKLFNKYRRCTRVYTQRYSQGSSFEKLLVPTEKN